jgi:hypothetical protein
VRDLERPRDLRAGMLVVVGNDQALAVAEVVAVDDDGGVLVHVLPGNAEDHLHLVGHGSSAVS